MSVRVRVVVDSACTHALIGASYLTSVHLQLVGQCLSQSCGPGSHDHATTFVLKSHPFAHWLERKLDISS